jgi:hypothetical protein
MVRMICLATALALVALTATAFAQTPTAEQRAACGADVKKFCSNVTPGGGRLIKCLSEQKDKVSAACRKSLQI